MPMEPEELDEMKALIAVARKRALSFGACLGKKPEGTIFYMHRMKSFEILQRQAKKAGETPKIMGGEVEVKGKVLSLTCDGDVPAGAAKNMRLFLRDHGLPMKIKLIDLSGNTLDGDDDEDADAVPAADATETEPQADDPQAANWAKVQQAFEAPVARIVAAGGPKAGAIEKAWDGAQAAAQKGNYKDALAVAGKIKPLLTAETAAPATAPEESADPNAAKWTALAGPLGELYTKALAGNPSDRTRLEAAYAMAVEKAEAGDYASALAIAAKLKPALDAARAAPGDTETAVPRDVVDFQKSRVLWAGTRAKMQTEMGKLQAAIIAVCAEDPDLAPVADEARDLTQRLSVFDARLEDKLDEITNAQAGPDREGLKTQARGLIKEYETALSDGFFQDVDTDNGFVNVAVAATAVQSLNSISRALS